MASANDYTYVGFRRAVMKLLNISITLADNEHARAELTLARSRIINYLSDKQWAEMLHKTTPKFLRFRNEILAKDEPFLLNLTAQDIGVPQDVYKQVDVDCLFNTLHAVYPKLGNTERDAIFKEIIIILRCCATHELDARGDK